MIVWMIYSVAVALIVAAAARAADWLARLGGHSVRWIWAGALGLTIYLSIAAALPADTAALGGQSVQWQGRIETSDAGGRTSAGDGLAADIERLRGSLDASLRAAMLKVDGLVAPAADGFATSLSLLSSLTLALILMGVGRRFARARREWPRTVMHGVGVRVSPKVGPFVLGVVHPEIVVPSWLLSRDDNEQRLVVAHEDEHVRARDPLLLGVGWGAVVAAPWNPVIWYMLSRLRLAIELDCDARVLRRGAGRQSYGSLLIDVAQHASALRLSAVALVGDPSHLRQRILAMTPLVPRFARLRAAIAAGFVLTGLLVACQATLPTNAEREGAEGIPPAAAITEVPVRGKLLLAPEGRRKPTHVAVYTRPRPAGPTVTGSILQLVPVTADTTTERVDSAAGSVVFSAERVLPLTPLILIDGTRASDDDVKRLDRLWIESVTVLKGPAAASFSSHADAVNGVILIKTRR